MVSFFGAGCKEDRIRPALDQLFGAQDRPFAGAAAAADKPNDFNFIFDTRKGANFACTALKPVVPGQ